MRDEQLGVTRCSIITTAPNAAAAEIHDRMPAILPQAEYATWLSLDTLASQAKALPRPCQGAMIAYLSSEARRVGKECVSTVNSRGLPCTHKKKKKHKNKK